jgi:NADH-quinone oxidoreductase subunit G
MSAMVKVEVDGRPVEVPAGSMVMEATNRLGIYVPHFCWHPQLSIAANCRMCLVQVEKAPKPMPACATPVAEGMKISTRSEYAKQAQRSVMEFLLINHPLDCPICDQGGECQLQDLAVGYGGSSSRYTEPKRVVLSKPMGPLISAEEMTRCIHCTRCVRFGQEIAGVMELGMIGRGEHAEIVSFVGQAVDSELSGNMIDICPVGALTSKPFRYTARTWELGRRRSVSPHDGLGSNLVVQVKQDRVMRVVPFEQPELNECWLSDKDRFSYEGLNSEDRLTKPMLRQGGDWEKALAFAAEGLRKAKAAHGAASIGALVSPHATLEEMHLAQKVVRGLGSENVDCRLRQSDFAADGKLKGAPWLGMKVAELAALDRVLVVGSFLRKDHPLIAHRFRQAAKRGQQVSVIHVAGDDLAIKLNRQLVVRPGELVPALAQVARAVAEEKGVAVPPALGAVAVGDAARAIAESLASGQNVGIFLGNSAQQHPRAGQLHALAQAAAAALGARFGFLGEAANSVGGYLARCVPGAGGLNAAAMLTAPRKAYLLLNVEPELDTANPGQAARAMDDAEFVIALTPYKGRAPDYADVLLPVTPFTETSGSFVNAAGDLQAFNPVVKPRGESRPAWKVLRVLGNALGLAGFDYERSEQIRDEACRADAVAGRLSNALDGLPFLPTGGANGLERVADVPIYFADPIVRRAHSLQQTADAAPPRALANATLLARLGLKAGDRVRVRQDGGEALLEIALDDALADGVLRVAAAHPATAALGAMFGEIAVERA